MQNKQQNKQQQKEKQKQKQKQDTQASLSVQPSPSQDQQDGKQQSTTEHNGFIVGATVRKQKKLGEILAVYRDKKGSVRLDVRWRNPVCDSQNMPANKVTLVSVSKADPQSQSAQVQPSTDASSPKSEDKEQQSDDKGQASLSAELQPATTEENKAGEQTATADQSKEAQTSASNEGKEQTSGKQEEKNEKPIKAKQRKGSKSQKQEQEKEQVKQAREEADKLFVVGASVKDATNRVGKIFNVTRDATGKTRVDIAWQQDGVKSHNMVANKLSVVPPNAAVEGASDSAAIA